MGKPTTHGFCLPPIPAGAAGCWRLLLSAPQMPDLQWASTLRPAQKLPVAALPCAFSTGCECWAPVLEMSRGKAPAPYQLGPPHSLTTPGNHMPVGGARGCSQAAPPVPVAQIMSTATFPRCFSSLWE